MIFSKILQIKGYDFEILESFQSYIHNLAENIGVDVGDAWATPATTWKVHTYAEESTVVKETYTLQLYERNVQIGKTIIIFTLYYLSWLLNWHQCG